MTDTLFAAPRRRKGATEALLDKTLRAWHQEGVLQGDSHAAARGILRDAARNVDRARADVADGTMTPLQGQRVLAMYAELLTTFRPGEEAPTNDAIDDLIASISATPVCD